jgi:Fe-Mn family superoxide dismutase
MDFVLPPLPYAKNALEPVTSKETLDFHYDKHHQGYLTKLKGLLEGKPEASKSLEEIVKSSSGAVFNNAAQVYNHTFFWNSMRPSGGGAPPAGPVADLIKRDFGGWEQFRDAYSKAGMGRFGSGYVWLVLDKGKASIVDTANAETPLTTSAKPLLTTDVWEHAYYIDYRNRRDTFLEAFLDKLVNWNFVAANLAG